MTCRTMRCSPTNRPHRTVAITNTTVRIRHTGWRGDELQAGRGNSCSCPPRLIGFGRMLLVRPNHPLQACRLLRYVLALAVIFFAATAHGHDPGLSSAIVRIERGHLSVQLGFHGKDIEALEPIDMNADGKIGRDEFAVARSQLEKVALDWAETSIDGQLLR